jgi:murein DD-endopeptidase MepM/ murein hydrolase activator NlpD
LGLRNLWSGATLALLALIAGLGPVVVPLRAAAGESEADAARGGESSIECDGPLVQGGGAVCRVLPDTLVQVGEAMTQADHEGFFVVGFDRDAPAVEIARVWQPDGRTFEHRFAIEAREYDISRIDGLPASQVDRFSKAQLAEIESSSARKELGDASRVPISAFRDRFAWPVSGRKTSAFGAQRILNGIEKRPHFGVDLAASVGTPIRAPADGVVSLADADLYFEGAMIVIDHGQGFLSKYLHVSRIDVEPGQVVRRGEVVGAVGSRGRSTAPHLCWRLKWRDRNLDPELWLRPDAPASPSAGREAASKTGAP